MINIDRFEQYLREGRLIRTTWVGVDEQGRATACWLSALFDEVAEMRAAEACPANELPPWFARLIPWMDDLCSETRWVEFASRLAIVLRAPRSPDQWHRAEYVSRALSLREAMSHTSSQQTLAVCDRVVTLCEAVASGAPRDDSMFDDAAEAAVWAASAAQDAARSAASLAEARAAESAAWAARAAARGAQDAVRAVASWAAVAASVEARSAARAAAADRIVDGVLSVLEGRQEKTCTQ